MPTKNISYPKGTQTESEKMGKGIHENGKPKETGKLTYLYTYIRQNRP